MGPALPVLAATSHLDLPALGLSFRRKLEAGPSHGGGARGPVCQQWAGGGRSRVRFLSSGSVSSWPRALLEGEASLSGVRELLVWGGEGVKQVGAGAGVLSAGCDGGAPRGSTKATCCEEGYA